MKLKSEFKDQVRELLKKRGVNENGISDLLTHLEADNTIPQNRFTLSDIEEDCKNGEMIDLPMCKLRKVNQGCCCCAYLRINGTCSRRNPDGSFSI